MASLRLGSWSSEKQDVDYNCKTLGKIWETIGSAPTLLFTASTVPAFLLKSERKVKVIVKCTA